MGTYLLKAVVLKVGTGVQVGCWFWGFDRVQGIESDCTVVFDGVQGVKGGSSAHLGSVCVVCCWFWGFNSICRVEGGGWMF